MKSCSGLPSPSAGIYTLGHLFMARAAETGGEDKKNRGNIFFIHYYKHIIGDCASCSFAFMSVLGRW